MSGRTPRRALDDVQRVLDHVEVAQAQEVHLEQADLLDRLHRELRDRAVDLRAVLARAGVGQLQRHDVGQLAVGDHDRGGVDRRVADDALQALRDVHDLLGDRVARDLVGQLLPGLQAVLEARRAAHDRVRDQLRQPVARAVVVAQHARGVARRGAREHLAEGDDLRHALGAVLLGHVADHALPAAHGEVDVDIRHRHALGVQEALEQQVVGQRVDVGDLQRVGDDRAGGAAAARADGDAVALGPVDEVPDDQEVGVEAHLVDDAELHLHALDGVGGQRVAVAVAHALEHQAAQVLLLRHPVRAVEARDQLAAERDLHLAAVRDLQRRLDRAGELRERVHHLLRGLQIELVRGERHLRRGQRRLRLHAQQRGVVVEVLAAQVVHVRRADERLAGLGREALHRLVDLVLLGEPVLLDLEVDVLRAEDLNQLVQVRARLVELALHDPLARAAGQAAGERDHALGVQRQQLQVHARLAAVQAFEEALGGERREVPEALVGRRQQRQVVALDLAVAHVAVVDEVGLEAQQRLDVVLLGGLVELDGAVHDAVVGQADGRLIEGRGALGELADVAGAVEQRVLGVDVQVRDGRGAHRGGNHRRRGGRHPCVARRRARNLRRSECRGCRSTTRWACAA